MIIYVFFCDPIFSFPCCPCSEKRMSQNCSSSPESEREAKNLEVQLLKKLIELTFPYKVYIHVEWILI